MARLAEKPITGGELTGPPSRVETFARGIIQFAGGRFFLWAILSVFVVVNALLAFALRINITDELYHLRIVDLYSGQLGWRLTNGPDTTGLGDVQYFVSFLYHYLLSFPARMLDGLNVDEVTKIGLLRLISLGFVVGAVLVWRQIALIFRDSKPFANAITLAILAIPMTSTLSAMVNYDSLLMLTSALTIYSAARIVTGTKFSARDWLLYAGFGSLSLIVKYTFAPVFLTLTITLLILRWGQLRDVFAELRANGGHNIQWRPLVAPGLLAVVALALTATRYLSNLFTAGSVSPSCDAVAPYDYCLTYGPFERNERLDAQYPDQPPTLGGAANFFLVEWFSGLVNTLALTGALGPNGAVGTHPTQLQAFFMNALAVLVIVMALFFANLAKRELRTIAFVALLTHIAAQGWVNFGDYRAFGEMVGVSGRYFMPFIPFLLLLSGIGMLWLIDHVKRHHATWRVGISLILLGMMTQGGGPLTVLGRSNDEFYHLDSPIYPVIDFLRLVARKLYLDGYVAS